MCAHDSALRLNAWARLSLRIGWKDYKASGEVCGLPLPKGLRESDGCGTDLHADTKAESGHAKYQRRRGGPRRRRVRPGESLDAGAL